MDRYDRMKESMLPQEEVKMDRYAGRASKELEMPIESRSGMRDSVNFAAGKSGSKNNTCLYLLIIFMGALLFAALVSLLGVSIALGVTKSQSSDVCTTPECVDLSSLIFKSINETVDPCDNFFEFACGNWAQNIDIDPPTLTYYAAAYGLLARNNRKIRDAFILQQGRGVEAVRKLQDFYASCLNTEVANTLGPEPLINLIAETGGWDLVNIAGDGTVTESWSLNGEQFLQEKLRGSPAFFTLTTAQDYVNPSRFIISVANSGLTMSDPSVYSDETAVEIAKSTIVLVLSTVFPMSDTTAYEAAADNIIALETELARIYQVGNFNPFDYEEMTLEQLRDTWMWTDYDVVGRTQAIFARAGVNNIQPNEPVQVQSPLYFTSIADALSGFDTSMLRDYAKWQIVLSSLQYLDSNCVAAFVALKQLGNPTQPNSQARADQCISLSEKNMPLALGRMFAEFILPPESVSLAADMTTAVMKAFRERVPTRDWLDNPTVKRAQNKVDLMDQMIAYPSVTFKDELLNAVYGDFDISATNLFDNYYQFLVNGVAGNLAQLRNVPNFWTTLPAVRFPTQVNAFYYVLNNVMFVLEGIMGIPFFSHEWPIYFQYGSLGAVIGHEITHGFDSNGRLYNETGQREMWWTDQSVQNFISRQQCFVEQYSNYGLFGINLDGLNTLAENIADAGGVGAAYRALQDTDFPKQMLPGLKYDTNQLFFISFGQLYCEKVDDGATWENVINDVHSPGRFRVIGTLQNSEEFSEAFGCKRGSFMNPENKCSLW